MKSIIALSCLFLVAQAKSFAVPADNPCHVYKPGHPNPIYSYNQCDLNCILLVPKEVVCSFDITQTALPKMFSTKSTLEFESYNNASSKPTYLEVCVSKGAITLDDLPLQDRTQCAECEIHEGTKMSTIKCPNLSGITYNTGSMFALESFKDKSVSKDGLLDAGIWKVPALQSRNAKLERVEWIITFENGLHYGIHTHFDN